MKYINGYTYEKVMEKINKYNNGTRSRHNSPEGICLYQDPTGNRCAVGCFIPDEYSHVLGYEGPVSSLLEMYPELGAYMPVDDIKYFQGWHDHCVKGDVKQEIANKLKIACKE